LRQEGRGRSRPERLRWRSGHAVAGAERAADGAGRVRVPRQVHEVRGGGLEERQANSNGTATLTVEAGKVTYDQTYTSSGKTQRVVQTYSYAPTAVRPIAGGHYDITLTFVEMTGDTQHYSPDKNRPKLEARKQAAGWEMGLITTDDQGVMGGVEFK
jgi:hypothetical protein